MGGLVMVDTMVVTAPLTDHPSILLGSHCSLCTTGHAFLPALVELLREYEILGWLKRFKK